MSTPLLIYGAYGYTGELIVREALKRGWKPIVAGRHAAKLYALAKQHGLDARVFDLDDSVKLDAGIEGMTAVIHCAGPFSHTALPMAEACLRSHTHYIDVTGEIFVFKTLAALDARARASGVMLLPGAGCDVVPSDCLAMQLKEQLPSATHLALGLYVTFTPSHGTAATMLENLPLGGAITRDGHLTPVPSAWKKRDIDFGERTASAVTIPWGDVFTAARSTGIPNVEVYMAMPPAQRRMAYILRYIGPLLSLKSVQRYLRRKIKAGGPSDAQRETGYCLFWGEVTDEAGHKVEARLRTPDGYTLTALTAVTIGEKILAGQAPSGFQTPSTAYGSGFIFEIEGITRG